MILLNQYDLNIDSNLSEECNSTNYLTSVNRWMFYVSIIFLFGRLVMRSVCMCIQKKQQ